MDSVPCWANSSLLSLELTLLGWTLPPSNAQCDAQNAKHCKLEMANYGLGYAALI
jgi:hypothetical protein